MINTPTVLVLGAGASAPYGYPTGLKLKRVIVDDLSNVATSVNARQILNMTGDDLRLLKEFVYALKTSGQPSIDSFLEHRSEFMEIGKIAIAQALISKESIPNMFYTEDWYQGLYRAMNTKFEDFGKNKISIITFNYDRSLDQFLFQALKSSYNKSDEETALQVQAIPIIHVYGQIGFLPWQKKQLSRAYAPLIEDEFILHTLRQSSKGIKIIHEELAEEDTAFKKSRELLSNAAKIIFLGFGYHTENLKRLGVSAIDRKEKIIIGSALNIPQIQRNQISRQSGIELNSLNVERHSIKDFLSHNVIFD
jgi:hypothetical protein